MIKSQPDNAYEAHRETMPTRMAEVRCTVKSVLLFPPLSRMIRTVMTEPELIKKPTRLQRICWYSLAVVVLLVVGLYAYQTTANRTADQSVNSQTSHAHELMSQIQRGMTFAEVAEVVPQSTKHEIGLGMHGGVFYDVPIGERYIIQLRFNHPVENQRIEDTTINYSPALRDRKTMRLEGEEQAWY